MISSAGASSRISRYNYVQTCLIPLSKYSSWQKNTQWPLSINFFKQYNFRNQKLMFSSIQTGKYFLRTRNIEQGKVSRLLRSPNFTVEEDSCLQFDFFDSAGETVDLTEIKTLSVTLQTFLGKSNGHQLMTSCFVIMYTRHCFLTKFFSQRWKFERIA